MLPLPGSTRLACASAALGRFEGQLWSEVLRLAGATPVAGAEVAGRVRPVITRHDHGAGTAWYVSTVPDPAALRALLDLVCAAARVAPVLPGTPDGVEAVQRGNLLFVLNHGSGTVEVPWAGRRSIG